MSQLMKFRLTAVAPLFGLVVAFQAGVARAQAVRVLEEGPIHEAYVPAITGVEALEAIPKPPPPLITERIPAKCDPEAIWIGGYWDYNDETEDFDWVGGCWRKPPPGRIWIAGLWKEFDEGWVWIRGYWSSVPSDAVVYIDDAPPDPVDEDPPTAPGSNYFWLAGYWGWAPSTGFVRYAGHWEPMDPNWVLVPASYTWAPDGYVFIAAYWDWPIDKRGCTYKSVYIEPASRTVEFVYEPVVIVEPAYVVDWCYGYYPDYVYFVHHHYHYHYDWWHDHYEVPTWWGWHGWWAFSWHDHWGLWWWYTNPGYPHPHFMNASLAASIYPASHQTILKVKKTVIHKHKIITEKGVISPKETLDLAKKSKGFDEDKGKKGKFAPVIAADKKDKLAKDHDKDKKDKAADDKGAPKALVASGTKPPKKDKDEDDVKKHPAKPKAGKTDLTGPSGTKPTIAGPGAGLGKEDGKDKDKDKDKDKPKTKGSMPPITVKGKDDSKGKVKDDGKPKGPPISTIGGDKGKDKDKDKDRPTGPPISTIGPDKGKDKDKDKPKGPPISPIGGDKGKDKDKPKGPPVSTIGGDKDKDKPKGGPPVGSIGGDKDKPKGPLGPTGGDKDKPRGGGGSPPPTGDLKIKDKPPKIDPKPGPSKPPESKPPKPPASSGGGGKDKDRDGGKKKDKS